MTDRRIPTQHFLKPPIISRNLLNQPSDSSLHSWNCCDDGRKCRPSWWGHDFPASFSFPCIAAWMKRNTGCSPIRPKRQPMREMYMSSESPLTKTDNTPVLLSQTTPPRSPRLHAPDRKEATMIAAHAPEMDEELLDRITLAAEELLQRQLEYKVR